MGAAWKNHSREMLRWDKCAVGSIQTGVVKLSQQSGRPLSGSSDADGSSIFSWALRIFVSQVVIYGQRDLNLLWIINANRALD